MQVPRRALFSPAPGKAAQAKARLFEAALRIFGERGPDGATVRDIARAAGQNVASIAYYFGSKGKLYQAVVEGIVRTILEGLEDLSFFQNEYLGEIDHRFSACSCALASCSKGASTYPLVMI